jgi:hypothetical protein
LDLLELKRKSHPSGWLFLLLVVWGAQAQVSLFGLWVLCRFVAVVYGIVGMCSLVL